MSGMRQQLRDNLVAITSLVVALSALGYNTWRNEVTERNRNVLVAGIEMLKEIGSLPQVMPPDVTHDAAALRTAWERDAEGLVDDEDAFRRIDASIEQLRRTTVAALKSLR